MSQRQANGIIIVVVIMTTVLTWCERKHCKTTGHCQK